MKRTNKQGDLKAITGPGGFRTLLEIRESEARKKLPRARTTIKINLSACEFNQAQLQLEALKTQELMEISNAKWKHVHQEMARVTKRAAKSKGK